MNEVIVRKTGHGYVVWGEGNQVYLCKSFRELVEKEMEIFEEVNEE